MAKIPEYLNVGDRNNLNVEQLLLIVEQMYTDIAVALNKKPEVYIRTTDGLSTDTFLNDGDININSNTLKVEMLTDHDTSTSVIWTQLS